MDKDAIEKLKAQHGKNLALVEIDGTEIVVRGPKRSEWECYKDTKDNGETSARSQLVRDCIVHPDLPTALALLDTYPVAGDMVFKEIAELGYGAEKYRSKKL